jgi:hypothetical protein
MAAESTGWNSKKKCDNVLLYCNSDTRSFVQKLEPQQRGNWKATQAALHEFYGDDEPRDRYSREQLDRFIRKERSIKKKKEFIKYYREFAK